MAAEDAQEVAIVAKKNKRKVKMAKENNGICVCCDPIHSQNAGCPYNYNRPFSEKNM